jgi:hypothetical protein
MAFPTRNRADMAESLEISGTARTSPCLRRQPRLVSHGQPWLQVRAGEIGMQPLARRNRLRRQERLAGFLLQACGCTERRFQMIDPNGLTGALHCNRRGFDVAMLLLKPLFRRHKGATQERPCLCRCPDRIALKDDQPEGAGLIDRGSSNRARRLATMRAIDVKDEHYARLAGLQPDRSVGDDSAEEANKVLLRNACVLSGGLTHGPALPAHRRSR